MESSARNSNRTNTRNEGALNTLATKLPTPRSWLFYQYCNNSKCREVTMLILPLPCEASEMERKAFELVVQQTDIPGLILEYPNEDTIRATCLSKNAQPVIKENIEWETVLKWMHNKQVQHEGSSGMEECAAYEHKPLPKGKWKSETESTRFSNEARAVPGVRHIDVDGLFHCPDCMVPLFIIEATSDGCPGTPMQHKHKATSMTRKLGAALHATPLMIQHHYEDIEHEKPVYLTSWVSGKAKRYNRTWDMLVTDFENALNRHKEKDCSA